MLTFLRWRRCRSDERGQMAFFVVLMFTVVALFFALAVDAGFWYFDHRRAQNQAEAAALAGVLELPASSKAAAEAAAESWLAKNGVDLASCDCEVTVTDRNGADQAPYSRVSVTVRRKASAFFAKSVGIYAVRVSARATALAGAADGSNVMPWGIVAPDPDCGPDATRNCLYDYNNNGRYDDPGDCNDSFDVCPFGLTADRLYSFKQDGSSGSVSTLRVCGSGNDAYRNCLAGGSANNFYEVGDEVATGAQPGERPNATDTGLQARAPAETWKLPGGSVCDVDSKPDQFGYDPDGKEDAIEKFVNPTTNTQCAYRIVPVPIVKNLPGNSGQVIVIGIASFGVANWDRVNGAGKGKDYFGTPSASCRVYSGKDDPPVTAFPCGDAWGYIFSGVTPPDALLQQIGESNNPFAPILIALID